MTGEVLMKQFRIEEASRLGLKPGAIAMRFHRGQMKHVSLRRVSPRVIWVSRKKP